MKKITLMVLCLALALSFIGCAKESAAGSEIFMKHVGEGKSGATTVQVIEEKSNTEESFYRIGAALPSTDFSSIGQPLSEMIAQEWKTYEDTTQESRMLSSHLWGVVGTENDDWNECENAIGFSVDNPLESLGWLNKTGYFGMDSTDPDAPTKHIQITAYASECDRKISEISVTAGYNAENVRITLTATLAANTKTYITGSTNNGYVTYEQATANTKSGIPVLILTSNGDFYDPAAYWVKDNVFYTLRVFGNITDKADIQTTLDKILEEI